MPKCFYIYYRCSNCPQYSTIYLRISVVIYSGYPTNEKGIYTMLKKITTVLIAAVTAFAPCGTSMALTLESNVLTDINGHWAYDSIITLNRAGILKGSGGKANPDSKITRGEFTALVSRALSLEASPSAVFGDVTEGSVFYNDISAAYAAGLVSGAADGNFYPNSRITREEIMLIISRCTEVKGRKTVSFTDIGKKYKYLKELTAAVSSGIINGYSDGTFKPNNNATRAEAATMTVRLLNSSEEPTSREITAFSERYIKNDAENMDKNIALSTGIALDELYYRLDCIDEINKNGRTVLKSVSNISKTAASISGMTANLTFTADMTYT